MRAGTRRDRLPLRAWSGLAFFALLAAGPVDGADRPNGADPSSITPREEGAALESALLDYQRGDYPAAFEAFRELAERGSPRAQTVLGIMYVYGEGVPRSPSEGAHWYHLAAAQSYAPAQYNLALFYLDGEGSAVDRSEASAWLARAALLGHTEAERKLAEIDPAAHAALMEEQRRRTEALQRIGARPVGNPQTLRPSRLARGPASGTPREAPPIPPTPIARSEAPGAERVSAIPLRTEAPPPRPPTTAAGDVFAVQLLAVRSEAAARDAWETYRRRFPAMLSALDAQVVRAELPERGTWYRLRVPMRSLGAAQALCAALEERAPRASCLALRTR